MVQNAKNFWPRAETAVNPITKITFDPPGTRNVTSVSRWTTCHTEPVTSIESATAIETVNFAINSQNCTECPTARCSIGKQTNNFVIDSGAAVSIFSFKDYDKLQSSLGLLSPTDKTLVVFGGTPIPTKGKIKAQVTRNSSTVLLDNKEMWHLNRWWRFRCQYRATKMARTRGPPTVSRKPSAQYKLLPDLRLQHQHPHSSDLLGQDGLQEDAVHGATATKYNISLPWLSEAGTTFG